MRKLLLIIILMGIKGMIAYSQTPIYSMYVFNKLHYNPGFTGIKDNLTVGLHYRNQWVGVDGAPKTMSFYAHTPIENKRAGIGISYVNDEIGIFNTSLSNIYYAYSIKFKNEANIRFGLNFQWDYTSTNFERANAVNFQDVAIPFDASSKSAFNGGFGFYYEAPKYFVGLSVVNLIRTSSSFLAAQDASRINHSRTVYLMGGTIFKLNSNLLLKPTVLVRYLPSSSLGVDLNLNVLLLESFWIGAIYRLEESVSAFVRVPVMQNLNVGIGVDYPSSQFNTATKKTFEVMVEYVFNGKLRKTDKVDNIRFFW